jgi:hypothetical protein
LPSGNELRTDARSAPFSWRTTAIGAFACIVVLAVVVAVLGVIHARPRSVGDAHRNGPAVVKGEYPSSLKCGEGSLSVSLRLPAGQGFLEEDVNGSQFWLLGPQSGLRVPPHMWKVKFKVESSVRVRGGYWTALPADRTHTNPLDSEFRFRVTASKDRGFTAGEALLPMEPSHGGVKHAIVAVTLCAWAPDVAGVTAGAGVS